MSSNCTIRKTDVQPQDTGLEKENKGCHGQQTTEEPLKIKKNNNKYNINSKKYTYAFSIRIHSLLTTPVRRTQIDMTYLEWKL